MAAYNDRRSGEDRRKGDRRWLSIFTGRRPLTAINAGERRSHHDRRKKSSWLNTGL